ncbi:hypothetical protein [Actinoallomurus acaciae]|uniref:Uncharacterized protein n=1 Tax=Actinoallomurus acaciae TaxID=502577 RepID=A0ABV5YUS2_9ACTN
MAMPGAVVAARVILWIKVALVTFALLALWALSDDVREELTPAENRALTLLLVWMLVYACAIAYLAVRMGGRRRWIRIAVIVAESLSGVSGVITLVSGNGNLGHVVAIGLAVTVIACMSGEAKYYFTH